MTVIASIINVFAADFKVRAGEPVETSFGCHGLNVGKLVLRDRFVDIEGDAVRLEGQVAESPVVHIPRKQLGIVRWEVREIDCFLKPGKQFPACHLVVLFCCQAGQIDGERSD